MGFKNLLWFNLAMLAKQGWRMLQNPNFLIARIYKAVYFPYNDFWTKELGTSPSFSWRSILAAREVLKTGVRWQVGNGKHINIWSDAWLLGVFPHCSTSPPREDAPKLVADLIDFERGKWRLDVLERHFS